MKIRIRIGAVLLATTFVATFFAILFGCYPVKKHWQINPDPGSTYSRPKPTTTEYLQESQIAANQQSRSFRWLS